MKTRRFGMFLVGSLMINLLWGLAPIFDGYVARSTPLFGTVLVTRALVAGVLALVVSGSVALITGHAPFATNVLTWRWAVAAYACTLAGAALYLGLLRVLSADAVAFLTSLYPIATTLILALLQRETIHWTKLVALLIFVCAFGFFFYGDKLFVAHR